MDLVTFGEAMVRLDLAPSLKAGVGGSELNVAVLASLVLIVAARLLFPWMSILSQLIGIGLPVVLLIALYWPRKASPLGTA